jgi:uncharacterized membrane protein HdeD (DUF308 family)
VPPAVPLASSSTVQPTWHRALEVGAGVLAIVLAAVAIADPGVGLLLLVFLFALALLWIGVWRLTRAWARNEQAGWRRSLDAILGVGAIAVSFVVISFPGLGLLTLVLLLYFGLVLVGFTWLGAAATRSDEPDWYRALAGALGVFSLIAAVVALFDVGVAVLTLLFLLAVVLLLVGLGDLIAGATGRPYRPPLVLPVGLRPPGPPVPPPAS